jgi:hypothetical protein
LFDEDWSVLILETCPLLQVKVIFYVLVKNQDVASEEKLFHLLHKGLKDHGFQVNIFLFNQFFEKFNLLVGLFSNFDVLMFFKAYCIQQDCGVGHLISSRLLGV